jgi:hypothetical protein
MSHYLLSKIARIFLSLFPERAVVFCKRSHFITTEHNRHFYCFVYPDLQRFGNRRGDSSFRTEQQQVAYTEFTNFYNKEVLYIYEQLEIVTITMLLLESPKWEMAVNIGCEFQENVAGIRKENNACRALVGKPLGKRPFGVLTRR